MREAGGAEEALAAVDDQAPELVLLDVVLPGTDGWELLKRLQERHGSIPVIMFSGQVELSPPTRPSAGRATSSASRSTRSSSSTGRSSCCRPDGAR